MQQQYPFNPEIYDYLSPSAPYIEDESKDNKKNENNNKNSAKNKNKVSFNKVMDFSSSFLVFSVPIGVLTYMHYKIPASAFEGHSYANPSMALKIVAFSIMVWVFAKLFEKIKNDQLQDQRSFCGISDKNIIATLSLGVVFCLFGVCAQGPKAQLAGMIVLLVVSFTLSFFIDRQSKPSQRQNRNADAYCKFLSALGFIVAVLTPVVMLSIMDVGNKAIFANHSLLNPSAGIKISLSVAVFLLCHKFYQSYKRAALLGAQESKQMSQASKVQFFSLLIGVGSFVGTFLSSATPGIQVMFGCFCVTSFIAGMLASYQHETATEDAVRTQSQQLVQ